MLSLNRIADNYAFMMDESKKSSIVSDQTLNTENDIYALSKRVLNTLEEYGASSQHINKPNEEVNKKSLFGHSKQR